MNRGLDGVTKKIKEFATVYDGPHATPTKTKEGPYYLGINAIAEDGKINLTDSAHLSEDDYKIWTKRVTPQKNDIVFSYEATLGRYAIIPENFRGCLGRRLAIVRVYSSEVNPIWLYYYFFSPAWKKYISNRIIYGSTVNRISVDEFPNYEVVVPSREKQDKIANALSSIDEKIANNDAISEQLESMAKTIYDYWFLQFEFPNEEGKPYKSSGGKMVWNEELQREIPEGWGVDSISSMIDSKKTGDWGKETKQGDYSVPVSCVRGADLDFVTGKSSTFPPTRFILEKNGRKLLEPYDIVVEISGGSPTQSTGRMAGISPYLFDRFDNGIICSNFCKAIKLKDEKDYYYFMQTWKLLYENNVMFNWEGKTSGIKNLMFDSFTNNTKIVIPNMEQISRFFELSDGIEEEIQTLLQQNQHLRSLRDFLLPLLMNGQVSIE